MHENTNCPDVIAGARHVFACGRFLCPVWFPAGIYRCQSSGQRFSYRAWHSERCSPATGLRLIRDLLLTADVLRAAIMNYLKHDPLYESEREKERITKRKRRMRLACWSCRLHAGHIPGQHPSLR